MNELLLLPMDAIVGELKRRNISFLLCWVDHQQFTKDEAFKDDVVWAIDSGGNLALQTTLLRYLTAWHEQVLKQRTAPEMPESP